MRDYARLTPTDANALFNEFTQSLSENKTIQYALRLQELENAIESGELQFVKRPTVKYKVGDTVWYRDLFPRCIKGITYNVKQPHEHARAYTVSEEYLFATKEQAESQTQKQKGVGS